MCASCNRNASSRVEAPTTPAVELVEPDFKITDIDTSLVTENEVIPIEKQKFSVVHMIKHPCYGGGCATFEFSLLNDGIAFLTCKEGCKQGRGNFYAYIGREKSKEFLDYIHNTNLLQLNSFYPTNGRPVAHIPETVITLSIDEHRSKRIRSFHHAPDALSRLEKNIEYLIANTNWERSYE